MFFLMNLSGFQIMHSKELNNFNDCAKKRSSTTNIVESNKQLKLCEVGKIPVRKLSDGEFNDANLKLIIDTVSPFSLIEHPAFITYCKLTSNKIPVSRRVFVRRIETLYGKMIEEMITDFEKIKYVCLTCDCWSIFHR